MYNSSDLLKCSGIYKIVNTVNGRSYYGSAKCFKERFAIHRTYLNKGTSRSTKLQNAWSKYGESSFEFVPMLVCSVEQLLLYEQKVLDGFKAVDEGYNICRVAGSALGVKRRPESIAKTRAAHIGRVHPPEVRAKMGIANIGRKHTAEHIAKVVAATTGSKRSVEFCEALGNRSRGIVTSEATKALQRQAALSRDSARGQNNVNAKMTPEKVLLIRAKYLEGTPLTDIGREVGLHPSTVAAIARRKTWRHVE